MSNTFVCCECKRTYHNSYTSSHAPANLCYDCWQYHFEVMKAKAANGGEWEPLDQALWLIASGFTHSEAAAVISVSRTTLWRHIKAMKAGGDLPEWLKQAVLTSRNKNLAKRGKR